MNVEIYFFLVLYVIFSIHYYVVDANPLIGETVVRTGKNEYPFIVSMNRMDARYPDNYRVNHACSATLITRQDVVTAEHCVVFEEIELSQIVGGSHDLKKCSPFKISWWISYEQWAVIQMKKIIFNMNDISLIRLLEPVSNAIVPAPLADISLKDLYGSTVIAAGWGRQNITFFSRYMIKAELKVLTPRECNQRARALAHETIPIDKRQIICTAANPYVLLHDGDSGGPLLYENALVGINKGTFPSTIEDRNPSLLNIHVGISYYKKFLTTLMNDGASASGS